MTCAEARQHWHLYHDSEGDARLHLEIEEHLAGCPACAAWFPLQSRLEDLVTEKLAEPPADPALWTGVLAGAGLKQPKPARRWFWLAGVAATAATVLLVVGGIAHLRTPSKGSDLAQVSATWHERLQSGQEPVQFASASDHEVEAYLKGRVPFPVRCPPRKDAGFAVRGAGVSEIEGRPAAYLSGTVGDVPVSILVLPRDSLPAFPAQRDALRQHGVVHAPAGPYAMVLREFDRNAIVVVGRTDPAALERVVNAYGSYPDHN
jgi:anti-sigma factor RsiW